MRRFFVLFFAAASGYISLSQEMLWMRAVGYVTGGSSAVFAHVLGFFLIGVALGALFAERLCEKRFASAQSSPVRFVGMMLILSALFYYSSIAFTAWLFTQSPDIAMASMYGIVAVVSFLLGGVFPVLCHYGAKAGQSVGLAVSRLYLANIIGCTLGPLLTGFVLMEYLSTDRIVLLLSVATLALGGIAFLFEPRRSPILPVAAAACGIGLLVLVHPAFYQHLMEKLHYKTNYTPKEHYKYLIENRDGIIAVQKDWTVGADMMYGGAIYDGNFNVDPVIDYNGITRAYLIAALHPNPTEVMEIGLATGSWSRVIKAYEPVRRHVVVEINPRYLELIKDYSPQKDLLDDPEVKIHIDDGRRWLKRHSDEKFDFILQNTTFHFRSESTNLLSEDYFRMTKQHLKPGGVLYLNTTRSLDVVYTVAKVFKHVVRAQYFIAASDEPFSQTPAQIRANLMKFRFKKGDKPYFDTQDKNVLAVMDRLANWDLTDIAPQIRQRTDLRLITDDNMLTEYKRQWVGPGEWWSMRPTERGKVYDGGKTWGTFFAKRSRGR